MRDVPRLHVTAASFCRLQELSQALPGVQLPVTLVFDYPSVSAMTELILQSTGGAAIKN